MAFFLFFSALVTGLRDNNYLLTFLLIPMILYFLVSYYRIIFRFAAASIHPSKTHSFHFLLFITQDDPLFLVTFGLFILATTFTIIKGLIL